MKNSIVFFLTDFISHFSNLITAKIFLGVARSTARHKIIVVTFMGTRRRRGERSSDFYRDDLPEKQRASLVPPPPLPRTSPREYGELSLLRSTRAYHGLDRAYSHTHKHTRTYRTREHVVARGLRFSDAREVRRDYKRSKNYSMCCVVIFLRQRCGNFVKKEGICYYVIYYYTLFYSFSIYCIYCSKKQCYLMRISYLK